MTVTVPQCQVLADGEDITSLVESWSVQLSLEGSNATAEIHCIQRPANVNPPNGMGENNTIEIWAGYSGSLHQVFGGFVNGTRWQFPGFPVVSFPCRDKLSIVTLPWGRANLDNEELEGRIYDNHTDGEVIRNILEAYGLPSEIASIEEAYMDIGYYEPVVLTVGTPGWSLIEEIDNLLGWRTFTTRQGTIFRRQLYNLPGSADHTIASNILSFNRERTIPRIVNQIRMTGIVINGEQVQGQYRTENPDTGFWLPDPPGTVTQEIRSHILDDSSYASDLAEFWVAQFDRPRERYRLRTFGMPLLNPAERLDVTCPGAEFGGSMLISGVSHTFSSGGFFTDIDGYEVWSTTYPSYGG